MATHGFMDCGLDNTVKCMCVVESEGGDHCVELRWGAVRGRKEEEAQEKNLVFLT